jgi:C-terminal processing protease CtpA/Prc
MKRWLVGLVALVSVAAVAGEGHDYKCDASMEECATAFKTWAENETYSGIFVEGLFSDEKVTITEVAADSPAAQAGVMAGDVLVAVNGNAVTAMTKDSWKAMKAGINAGDAVWYKLDRNGATKKVKVTVTAFPMDLAAQKLGYHLMKSHMDTTTATAANHD